MALNRLLNEARGGKIITPVVAAALTNPDFQGFEVEVEGWEPRPYDGWFHPSTHATWTARQLTYYLLQPDMFEPESPTLMFVLSVTQGKFWHRFIQRLLLDKKILVQDEAPLKDESTNRQGHADGILYTGEWFEFKTASERVIRKLKSAEDVIEHKPGYYAQTQDYLDMAGVPSMRYFVMMLSAPFHMEEFVVPADPAFQAAQRTKYQQAISAALTGELPPECCTPRSNMSKECPARYVCPIGSKNV